jgi:hypothetical protein
MPYRTADVFSKFREIQNASWEIEGLGELRG